ncbi:MULTISPECIES: GntR family transcriptional regulator [unclassified Cryobacterium]|uniref:GntR family transcriptional regulator n=1 Tax=unclassified Cryobacterium TaxID=2649013 RepID=UPI002AB56C3E|nr:MULTISPECIES: GntR family transcriptional regulator [Cryobacterium]MDY7526391.1 GntR family transcriptional regulator [Cryobacterium sp. 10C2]MDY7557805.1 GntR family transcriptional regulator [Cryobacterium sp. 10C3]MEB0004690.1 GntR family transcriptional regulator [Cryobacterium sp. RTC2.1]MEB0203430.1 GntR family transcriptional regulator [Cryobacterium sp. 5I3]MEB0287753.1 GntR family transcriptional regulator [Cryobacterium sp. 10S3]
MVSVQTTGVTRGAEPVTGGQAAFVYLRRRILSGEIPARAVLREQSLAEELGLSRTPVREALRRLDEAGFVDFTPNRGATVASWTQEQVRETYYLRAGLESRAAGLAATRIGDEILGQLADLIVSMDEFVLATDDEGVTRLGELNAEFHHISVAASGNQQLIHLTDSVGRIPMMAQVFRRDGGRFRAGSNHHHRDILTALRTHDAVWAEAMMRAHILGARNAILDGDSTDLDTA